MNAAVMSRDSVAAELSVACERRQIALAAITDLKRTEADLIDQRDGVIAWGHRDQEVLDMVQSQLRAQQEREAAARREIAEIQPRLERANARAAAALREDARCRVERAEAGMVAAEAELAAARDELAGLEPQDVAA